MPAKTKKSSQEGRPSQFRLRSLLHYDPETGEFTYLVRAARRVHIGDVAGSVNNQGYRHIRVDGKAYKAHRLAWLYVYGEWPAGFVDHINGNRSDNRIRNLRIASRTENLANSKVFRSGKASPKGISQVGSKWTARIQRHGQSKFLGYFDNQHDAASAYRAAASIEFGQFARAL